MTEGPATEKHLLSVVFAILAAFTITLTGDFGKQMGAVGHLPLIIFLRFFAPFILLLLYYFIFIRHRITLMHLKHHILRSIFTVLSQYCFFYVLIHENIFVAILMLSTYGFFIPLIARVALKKPIFLKTAIAIIISFTGVFISLFPLHHLLSFPTLVGLGAGFFAGASQVTMYHSSQKMSLCTINLFMYGLSALFCLIILPFSIPFSAVVHLEQMFTLSFSILLLLFLFSIATLCNQFFLNAAYKHIHNPATITPFLYTSIIFSALIDYIWSGIIPHWNAYLGIVLVIGSSVVMAIKRKDLQKI